MAFDVEYTSSADHRLLSYSRRTISPSMLARASLFCVATSSRKVVRGRGERSKQQGGTVNDGLAERSTVVGVPDANHSRRRE